MTNNQQCARVLNVLKAEYGYDSPAVRTIVNNLYQIVIEEARHGRVHLENFLDVNGFHDDPWNNRIVKAYFGCLDCGGMCQDIENAHRQNLGAR